MSNEKMREEFAAWYVAEITESYGAVCRDQAEKNLAWVREDGSFADPMLRLASLAWQASREALVIELPSADEFDVPSFAHEAIVGCWNAIEAAGIKVKP